MSKDTFPKSIKTIPEYIDLLKSKSISYFVTKAGNRHGFDLSDSDILSLTNTLDFIRQLEATNMKLQADLGRKTDIEMLGLPPGLEIPESPGRTHLNFAFLFASPLLMPSKSDEDGKIQSLAIDRLDCKEEYQTLVSAFKKGNRAIRHMKCVATLRNLENVLNAKPRVLHLSAHGVIMIGKFEEDKDYVISPSFREYYILFENEMGCGNHVHPKALADLLAKHQSLPEVVFVSSCHSKYIGQVFLAAGALHVICVDRLEAIAEDVATFFAETFYNSFFSGSNGRTICDIYENSILKTKNKYSGDRDLVNEYKKLRLLRISNAFSNSHICNVVHGIAEGTPIEHLPCEPKIIRIPAEVSDFVGRNYEMYSIIMHLARKYSGGAEIDMKRGSHSPTTNARLVTITGLPGIGKSTVALMTARFCYERYYFSGGIVFVPAAKIETLQELEKSIYELIFESKPKEGMKQENSGQYQEMLKELKDLEVLLIIDGADSLIAKSKLTYASFLVKLLQDLPSIKIIQTSRFRLGVLAGNPEKVITIDRLDPQSSLSLFHSRAQKEITDAEKIAFLKEGSSTMPHSTDEVDTLMENHELIKQLSGHPNVISMTASLLMHKSLSEVYQSIRKSWSLDDIMMNPLKRTLKLCIEEIQNEESKTFYKFLALFPSGLTKNVLEDLWGTTSGIHLNTLQEYSLITCEEDSQGQQKFFLPYFMGDYALKYITIDIGIFQENACAYYAEKLKARLSGMKEPTVKSGIEDESNIIACLNYHLKGGAGYAQYLEEKWTEAPSEESKEVIIDEGMLMDSGGLIPKRTEAQRFAQKVKQNLANQKRSRLFTLERMGIMTEREKKPTQYSKLASTEIPSAFIKSVPVIPKGAEIRKSLRRKATKSISPYEKLLARYCKALIKLNRYLDSEKAINTYGEFVKSDEVTAVLSKLKGNTLTKINSVECIDKSSTAEGVWQKERVKLFEEALEIFTRLADDEEIAECIIPS